MYKKNKLYKNLLLACFGCILFNGQKPCKFFKKPGSPVISSVEFNKKKIIALLASLY